MSSSGGGTPAVPTGPASGDLSGGYPAPVVSQVQGRPVSNAAPAGSQAFVWNGALWLPSAVVNSFNARTGAVALSQADVGAVAVASFAGRIGGIVPTTGDYTAAQVTNAADKAAAAAQAFTGDLTTAGKVTTASDIFSNTNGIWIQPGVAGTITLRTVPGSINNSMIGNGGAWTTQGAAGAARNILDDGAGNMAAAGAITATGNLRGNSGGIGTAASGAAGRLDLAAGLVSFGYVVPGNGAASGFNLWSGMGAPGAGLGNNGDFYFRGDTPGTVNQRVYIKNAGAWVGIV